MFSYLHHIGDFNKATRHLSRTERSVYRDLIEIYYEHESPLEDDIAKLSRLVIARSNEELTAVEQVLKEFFHKTEAGWVHVRCELEIERYRGFKGQKSVAGKASAAKRAAKKQQIIDSASTGVERALNGRTNGDSTGPQREGNKPINHKTNKPINQEPITNKPQAATPTAKKVDLDYACWPDMPSEQTLTDWKTMRKRIKADVSQTVINSFGKEFHKAKSFGYTVEQCLSEAITRNWRGFKTEWLQNSQGAANAGFNRQQQKPAIDFNNTDWVDRVFESQFGEPAEQDFHVIEGDFSGVDVGNTGPGDVQPNAVGMAQGLIGKRN